MNTTTAATALRDSIAYVHLAGYGEMVEQVIRAGWTAERIRVELASLDADDDQRAAAGFEPLAHTNGKRTALLDVLADAAVKAEADCYSCTWQLRSHEHTCR